MKQTPGKWLCEFRNGIYTTTVGAMFRLGKTLNEQKWNAFYVSKIPEMLDMLIYVNGIVKDNNLSNFLKELNLENDSLQINNGWTINNQNNCIFKHGDSVDFIVEGKFHTGFFYIGEYYNKMFYDDSDFRLEDVSHFREKEYIKMPLI